MSIKNCKYAPENFFKLWGAALPKLEVVVSYLLCFGVCFVSSVVLQPRSLFMHLGVGMLVAGANAAYLWKNYGEVYRKVKSVHQGGP